MCDISLKEDILTILGSYIAKDWVKLIPIDKTVKYDDYNNKNDFKLVANIVIDNEIYTSGKKKDQKKRNTLIKFVPTIDEEDFSKKNEWLYIFTINNRIVKIGGTRTGLKGRTGSYLCGHHIPQRGKSGDCSKTNGYIYNTFDFYLSQGCTVEMYGYELPKKDVEIEVFGIKKKAPSQTYHAYESIYLEDYKRKYKEYPILSDNCDPEYKDKPVAGAAVAADTTNRSLETMNTLNEALNSYEDEQTN